MPQPPSTVVIVFVVLCFLIVLLKGVYDYNRFSNAHEKFLFDYKTKLSELASIGAASVGAAAAAGLAVAAGGVKGGTAGSRRLLQASEHHSNSLKPTMTKAKTKSDDAGRRQIEWLGGGGGNDADGFGVVEAGRDAEAVVTAVKEQQQQEKKRGANNCLFDATIEACGLIDPLTGGPANSQALREKCDEILKKEGFPLIPHGEPAGEQYLQALSLILNKKIKVYKGNRNNFVAEIKHSDVGDDDDDGTTSDTFSIVHVGSQLNGHWVAF